MRDTSEHDYLDTLSLIHEAALDPCAWLAVLRRLADLTDCVAGGLTVENPSAGRGRPITYFGFDPGHVERTFDHYLPMNPLHRIAASLQPGQIVTNGDVVPLDEFRRTDFYDGWARPQELCSPLTIVLHRDEPVFVPLTLVRRDGAGEATEGDRALLSQFAPHLMQALRTNLKLERIELRRDAYGRAFDRLALAVFLLDRKGRVIVENAAARAMLGQGTSMRLCGHTLQASIPAHDHLLQRAIGMAIAPDTPVAQDIRLDAGSLGLEIAVVPVQATTLLSSHVDGACLVFVEDRATRVADALAHVTQAYQLTPAEGRLLAALHSGEGLMPAARRLGIALETARTHLRNVFAKTGTHRQAELIILVQSTISALSELIA